MRGKLPAALLPFVYRWPSIDKIRFKELGRHIETVATPQLTIAAFKMRLFPANRSRDVCQPDSMLSPPALVPDPEFIRYTAPWRPLLSSAKLRFGQALEQSFEATTKYRRVRELRLTISLAVVFYLVTIATDPVLVPDIGWLGMWLRLAVVPPWVLFCLFAQRFTAVFRERYAATLATSSVLLLAAIVWFSQANTAAYGLVTAMLALIYVNTTYPLRFGLACIGTVVSVGGMLGAMSMHPAVGSGLAWTLTLLISVAGSYSLICCYRIERSHRLSFLLSYRESQRLSALAADRDAVAELSNRDALTGLSNRRHFDNSIAEAFRRPWASVALLMVDVDHFKGFNDGYGHPAGDATLRQVARIIGDAVRARGDLAARYGGEEFVLLLENLSLDQAKVIARRLCIAVADSAIAHAHRQDGIGVVTVSIGVATRTLDVAAAVGDDARLIAAADRALYEAKRCGRNRVEAAHES